MEWKVLDIKVLSNYGTAKQRFKSKSLHGNGVEEANMDLILDDQWRRE